MRPWFVLICAAVIAAGFAGACRPAAAEDTNCIVVTGTDTNGKDLTNADVYLEEDNGRGGWKKPDGPSSKKHVGAADKGSAKFCGLKPGKKYRVIGRKDGDDNKDGWHEFVFQPDTKTKQMAVAISIKMKAKRRRNG